MKNYKYRFETYSFFDYAGLERHLAKMAAKGWQLESIGRTFWKYRKTEPARLTYSVTYAPDASVWDPEPTEDQQALTDYCTAAGWRKVCDLAQLQIFCTDQENPTPIETDEQIRLDIIKKTMKKIFKSSHLLLGAIFLMNIVLRAVDLVRRPLDFLSDGTSIWSALILLWGLMLLVFDFVYFRCWVKQSEKNIAKGGRCAEPKGYRTFTHISWIGLLILIVLMLMQSVAFAKIMFLYGIGILFVIAGTMATQKLLKKKGVSKGFNIAVTLTVDCLLVVLLTAAIMSYSMSNHLFSREADDYYMVGDYQWKIYHDDLPLVVEDLIDSEYEYYSYEKHSDNSIFLSYDDCWQNCPPSGETPPPTMHYEVYTVKMDFLYDMVRREIEEDALRYFDEEGRAYSGYVAVSDPAWQADSIYQFCFGDSQAQLMENEWLICKDNKLIVFRPYFELTDEMKSIVTEKFAS